MGARRLSSRKVLALAVAASFLCARGEDEGHGASHGDQADHGDDHADHHDEPSTTVAATVGSPSPPAVAEASTPCPRSMHPYFEEKSPFGWPMAPADWTFEREDCWPRHYALCAGKLRSPLDIDLTLETNICPVETRGGDGALGAASSYRAKMGLRGKVSKYMGAVMAEGDFGHLDLVQGRYEATQVHITTPSVNLINGKRYDAELLVVHKPAGQPDALDRGVIVSVLFEQQEGAGSAVFAGLGFKADHSDELDISIPEWTAPGVINLPTDIQPALQGPSYLYNGSVPVPPCTENINWFVLGDAQPVSPHQVAMLKAMLTKHVPDVYAHARPVHARDEVPSECRRIEVNSLDIGGRHEEHSCDAIHANGDAHLTARCWDHIGTCYSKRFSAAVIPTQMAVEPPSGERIPLEEFMHYKPVQGLLVRPEEYSVYATVPNHGDMGHLMLKGHIFFAHNISVKPISAHTIDGVRHEAEINIEHVMFGDTYGQGLPGYIPDPHMVMVSIQVKQGKHSEFFSDLLIGDDAYHAAIRDGTSYDVEERMDLQRLLEPAFSGTWYWYSSNSTHPGCGNSIRWMVFETPIEASIEQLNSLHVRVSGVDSSQLPKSIPQGFLWKEHFPDFAVESNETDCANLPMSEWKYGSERPLWNYGNERCWAEQFPVCGSGTAQSPINVPTEGVQEGTDNFLHRISWKPVSHLRVSNTGHNVQVTNGQLGYTEFIGPNGFPDFYSIVQFHIHFPSEHMIGGKQYAAELHIVHKKQYTVGHLADDDLLVTGIMFDFGPEESPLLKQLFLHENDPDVIRHEGQHEVLQQPLDLARAVGPVLDGPFYRYEGGLTTPPCSEVVKWFVFETPMSMSESQWLAFKALYPNPANNRPIQPLNGRTVVKNSMDEGVETDYRFYLSRTEARDRFTPEAGKILVPIVATVVLMSVIMCAMFVSEESRRVKESAGGLTAQTIGKRDYTALPDKTPRNL